MRKDKELLAKMLELKSFSDGWLDYVKSFNPCAYSDRILEHVIEVAEEIKQLHEENFKEGK